MDWLAVVTTRQSTTTHSTRISLLSRKQHDNRPILDHGANPTRNVTGAVVG